MSDDGFTLPLNDKEIKEVKEIVAAGAKWHRENHPEEYLKPVPIEPCCWICGHLILETDYVDFRCAKRGMDVSFDVMYCQGKGFQLKKGLSGG